LKPSDRMVTSSSISERAPCNLVDPHRILATSATAASEAATVAEHRTPTVETEIRPLPEQSGSSRGALSSAIPLGSKALDLIRGVCVCVTEREKET
jgi:hypothetical protein